MLAPAADIMYSVDEDAGEVTFSANTAKGEQWMGGYKKTVPLTESKDYRDAAVAADLMVTAVPTCVNTTAVMRV